MLSSIPHGPSWVGNRKHDLAAQGIDILLNRYRRSIRCPDLLGARLQAGSIRAPELSGVGDCLCIDLSKGFFAVADSSDRDPLASRKFMHLFIDALLPYLSLPADILSAGMDFDGLKQDIATRSQELLASLPFQAGCTFTGILVIPSVPSARGIVLHTGDSLLITCDLKSRETRQFTKTNFWMVGKTDRFFQIDELCISGDTRLLLATDGLADIHIPPGMNREEFLLHLFTTHAVEEIPDILFDEYDHHEAGRDDTAVIALNPGGFATAQWRIIMGGTSRHEEEARHDALKQSPCPDRYQPCLTTDI